MTWQPHRTLPMCRSKSQLSTSLNMRKCKLNSPREQSVDNMPPAWRGILPNHVPRARTDANSLPRARYPRNRRNPAPEPLTSYPQAVLAFYERKIIICMELHNAILIHPQCAKRYYC
jgi:hypothetical protein